MADLESRIHLDIIGDAPRFHGTIPCSSIYYVDELDQHPRVRRARWRHPVLHLRRTVRDDMVH